MVVILTMLLVALDQQVQKTPNSQGSSPSNANLPPYYVLCYIINIMLINYHLYIMKMKTQIIDNFLPPDQFKLAQSLIMDYGFPWMWNDSVTNQVGYSDPNEFQFIHLFYDPLSGVTTQCCSSWLDIVKPYGDKFNPIS